jgi:AcrR family transcriptional regulator
MVTVEAPPRPSTPAQSERVDRILAATLELLDEVGAQHLAVRDVADRAEVALGTLYRYFPSKDYLVAAALEHWGQGLVRRSRAARGRGPVAERLAKALRSIARSFAAHPNYALASVLTSASTDPLVPPALDAHRASFAAGIDAVLDEVPEATRREVRFVIEAVLIAQLVGFSSGRSGADELEAALLRAAALFDLEGDR